GFALAFDGDAELAGGREGVDRRVPRRGVGGVRGRRGGRRVARRGSRGGTGRISRFRGGSLGVGALLARAAGEEAQQQRGDEGFGEGHGVRRLRGVRNRGVRGRRGWRTARRGWRGPASATLPGVPA